MTHRFSDDMHAFATPSTGVDGTEKEPPHEAVEVVVCGGGPAGIAAAWTAARLGRRVLLVERYGRLGGMAVQGMVGPLMGSVQSAWVDELLDRIGGAEPGVGDAADYRYGASQSGGRRTVDFEFIDLKYAELLQQAGVDILLHSPVVAPWKVGNRVAGVRLLTKKGIVTVRADVTVDATGDGDVAVGAGARFAQGREAGPYWPADGLVQPASIMFRVSGVDHADTMEVRGGRAAFRFADGRSWNALTREAHACGELPETVGIVRTYLASRDDERVINATQVNGVDGTDSRDLTRAELEGRRQVQPILAFLRKYAPGFRNAYVSGMPAVIGVRETRRILGVACLTAQDLLDGKRSPQAVVRKASFIIDIHNPAGAVHAHPEGAIPEVKPYDIPYGCLVPERVGGLLTAGRCISGTHEAMASYRVQIIAMATGVAAGTAAALAATQGIAPRDVAVSAIQEVVFAEPME